MAKKQLTLFQRVYRRLWPTRRMVRWVAWNFKNRIGYGVFKGMVYHASATWGNPGNKLIGTYEQELNPYLYALDASPPSVIFDIGASEGYYTVGCVVRWPKSMVWAWEMSTTSRAELQHNAALNGVQNKIQLYEACTESTLYTALKQATPALIIIDIEGAEIELCSERCIELARARWIIECHSSEVVATLSARFSKNYEVKIIPNDVRTLADINIPLPLLLPNDRERLVDEGRPFPTPWLVAIPTPQE